MFNRIHDFLNVATYLNGLRDWLANSISSQKGYQNVFGFRLFNTSTQFNTFYQDRQKLQMVLSSPAVLKVFCLQCDLFSMGRVLVKQNDKELESDPFLDLLKNPNPFQTQAQFLWDYCLWLMLGNCNTYVNSKVLDGKNKMYHLDPAKTQWPVKLQNQADHFIFSDAEIKARSKETICYRYNDGNKFEFPLDRLIISNDLSNGLGNFYKGNSRLDALYKVISNSEHALDSKNINVRYAGKFLVGSNNTAEKMALGDDEKQDIIDKMETNDKRVFPLRTMVEIKRFVENMRVLELGTAFQEDFFIIGGMFNIPRDVLEAYLKSSTFENQEKARMAHVSYTLAPKGELWMDAYEKHFGYDIAGKNISISWDHLPMMGVFKQQESLTQKTQIETFTAMRSAGIPLKQVNEFLKTDFKEEKPKSNENGQGSQGQQNQGGQESPGGQEESNGGESNN